MGAGRARQAARRRRARRPRRLRPPRPAARPRHRRGSARRPGHRLVGTNLRPSGNRTGNVSGNRPGTADRPRGRPGTHAGRPPRRRRRPQPPRPHPDGRPRPPDRARLQVSIEPSPDAPPGAGTVVRRFAIGDQVIARTNHYRSGLLNGQTGTVVAVHPATGALDVRTPAGQLRLGPAYLAVGGLDHGYAITIHRAQGLTTDTALLLGGSGLYREAGYVALSRGRVHNAVHLVERARPARPRDRAVPAPPAAPAGPPGRPAGRARQSPADHPRAGHGQRPARHGVPDRSPSTGDGPRSHPVRDQRA